MSDFGSFTSPYVSGAAYGLRGDEFELNPQVYQGSLGPQGKIPTLSKDQLGSVVSGLNLSPDYLRQVMFSQSTPTSFRAEGGESGDTMPVPTSFADSNLISEFGDTMPGGSGANSAHTGYYTAAPGEQVSFADLRNALQQYGLPGSDQPAAAAPSTPTAAPQPYTPNFVHLDGIPYLNTSPSARGAPFGSLAPSAGGDQSSPAGVNWQNWMMGAGPTGSSNY
jgi:hypothetical protein